MKVFIILLIINTTPSKYYGISTQLFLILLKEKEKKLR